jgi:hypothetical protein
MIEGEALAHLLKTLPALTALTAEEHVDPILVQLQKHHAGTSLTQHDHATLAFVDDCISGILDTGDFDFKVESFIRDLAPLMAINVISNSTRSLLKNHTVYELIELMLNCCVGWSADLGVLGDQFMSKIEDHIGDLITGRQPLDETYGRLRSYFEKESSVYERMQDRLCELELANLASQKSRFFAAQLVNQHMTGKQLPLFIIFMLQGSWYELLQQVFKTVGRDSDDWRQLSAITEKLIWSVQPQQDTVKQSQTSIQLPDEIRSFLANFDIPSEQVEQCLADVIGEHEGIASNNPSPPCDFELLDVDTTILDMGHNIDPKIYQDLKALNRNSWFFYDVKNEPEEKVARLVLILNWQETDKLLFTNQNRRKVLQMSYHQFAGLLSTQAIKPLANDGKMTEVVRSQLSNIIRGVQTQKQNENTATEEKRQKSVSLEYLSTRKDEMLAALEELQKRSSAKKERAEILRDKAQKKVDAAALAVEKLRTDAWMNLPIMEGTLTPCKLVAIIPGSDKYIFANRAGIKVADYSSGQLSQMIVTEMSEIIDTGAEFENVLANVVTRTRQDKNKSFDELTGSTS